jgi:hypothetical protein
MLHTLDRMELAQEVNRRAGEHGRVLPVLVQVNIAREEQKGGMPVEEVESFLKKMKDFSHLHVEGLMSIMPLMASEEELSGLFGGMRTLYEQMRDLYAARGLLSRPNIRLLPFISDMPSQMAAADVVIARAGAMTVSELAQAGRAAILVPSPNVTGNHQYKNARVLSDAGAAVLLREEELPLMLCNTVERLLSNEVERAALSRAIRSFATPEAGARIWQDVLCLIKGKK